MRRNAPVEIRIVTMAEFHKSGLFKPLLWNCAATAARINRKAVYSVDIMYHKLFFRVSEKLIVTYLEIIATIINYF